MKCLIKADSADAFNVLDLAEKNNMSYYEIVCIVNTEREKKNDRINFPLLDHLLVFFGKIQHIEFIRIPDKEM